MRGGVGLGDLVLSRGSGGSQPIGGEVGSQPTGGEVGSQSIGGSVGSQPLLTLSGPGP